MCFDLDSHPPIVPIAGGALDSSELVLEAKGGAGILILPDVRGLHPYYEELALRFAENGVDALAIDYFGRTAGTTPRGDEFEHMSHVEQVTWAGLTADIRAAVDHLRAHDEFRVEALFSTGFCFGGRLAFLTATLGLGLAGSIGFYGVPVGPGRADIPAPADLAADMRNPILGLFGAADQAITPEKIEVFEGALTAAGVPHRLVAYDGAPHSFFDRKAAEFADASAQAWEETLTFIRGRTPSVIGA
jgi:carboxymethylenebutenolidase